MSKNFALYYPISAIFVLILQIFTQAQDLSVTISISGRVAKVEGVILPGFQLGTQNFYFQKGVVGNADLGKRASDISLTGETGLVSSRQLIPGEYLAVGKYTRWSYNVDLTPTKNRVAAAHASWIGEKEGVLMLDDLLPQFGANGKPVSAKVKLDLPTGWSEFTSDPFLSDGLINVASTERSIIFIGANLRNKAVTTKAGPVDLMLAGTWIFSDEEAVEMVREIYEAYSEMLGPLKGIRPRVSVVKFPTDENPGAWEAETRGETVTIISSDMSFKTQSQQRLHEQLRHEIFHLWFPNGVDLKGNYAWFYEGFALYESLKLGVKHERIRFEDFLDTLSRAYTLDANQLPRTPLVGSEALTDVYARGMVVAFLVDLELLKVSDGDRGAELRLAEMFRLNRHPGRSVSANDEIMSRFGVRPAIANYVLDRKVIDWKPLLSSAGIVSTTNGRTTTLSLSSKLTGGQKEILRHLGYNSQRKR